MSMKCAWSIFYSKSNLNKKSSLRPNLPELGVWKLNAEKNSTDETSLGKQLQTFTANLMKNIIQYAVEIYWQIRRDLLYLLACFLRLKWYNLNWLHSVTDLRNWYAYPENTMYKYLPRKVFQVFKNLISENFNLEFTYQLIKIHVIFFHSDIRE